MLCTICQDDRAEVEARVLLVCDRCATQFATCARHEPSESATCHCGGSWTRTDLRRVEEAPPRLLEVPDTSPSASLSSSTACIVCSKSDGTKSTCGGCGKDFFTCPPKSDCLGSTRCLACRMAERIEWPGVSTRPYCEPFVDQANTALDDLAKGLGDARVTLALHDAARIALLASLAKTLHHYVNCAKKELADAKPTNTEEAVDILAKACPSTFHAAKKITANFVNNVTLVCKRLLADWDDVEKLFFKPDLLVLRRLVKITSSGSDSHKGGLQVLILTFECEPTGKGTVVVDMPDSPSVLPISRGLDPSKSTDNLVRTPPVRARLVYKPSDIELDARIVGRTTGIGVARAEIDALGLSSVPDALSTLALVEQVNEFVPAACKLPVYRILPRFPGSTLGAGPGIATRSSYGYIEFLSNAPSDKDVGLTTTKLFDDAPAFAVAAKDHAHSDWILPDAEALKAYLQQCGAWIAVATTFSIIDLHAGNVIASRRRPHVIDLEMGFEGPVVGPTDTALLAAPPQFAGIMGRLEPEVWVDQKRDLELNPSKCIVALLATDGTTASAVSLRRCAKDGSTLVVDIYMAYVTTMVALRNQAEGFARFLDDPGWRNTVARFHLFATDVLYDFVRQMYGPGKCASDAATNKLALATFITSFISTASDMNGDDTRNVAVKPHRSLRTAANCNAATHRDLEECDLPCYYHRLGAREVLDSTGTPIPATSRAWQLPRSTLDDVLAQVRAMAGAGFNARVLRGLKDIADACGDRASARDLSHGGFRFRKGAGGIEWR